MVNYIANYHRKVVFLEGLVLVRKFSCIRDNYISVGSVSCFNCVKDQYHCLPLYKLPYWFKTLGNVSCIPSMPEREGETATSSCLNIVAASIYTEVKVVDLLSSIIIMSQFFYCQNAFTVMSFSRAVLVLHILSLNGSWIIIECSHWVKDCSPDPEFPIVTLCTIVSLLPYLLSLFNCYWRVISSLNNFIEQKLSEAIPDLCHCSHPHSFSPS